MHFRQEQDYSVSPIGGGEIMRCTFTGSKTDQMFLDQIKSSQNVGNRITQNCYYLARESFSKALKKKGG